MKMEEITSLNLKLWTRGESNSHTPDANRVHYHYATGPIRAILTLYLLVFNVLQYGHVKKAA